MVHITFMFLLLLRWLHISKCGSISLLFQGDLSALVICPNIHIFRKIFKNLLLSLTWTFCLWSLLLDELSVLEWWQVYLVEYSSSWLVLFVPPPQELKLIWISDVIETKLSTLIWSTYVLSELTLHWLLVVDRKQQEHLQHWRLILLMAKGQN